ncbi:FtsW/RodA/SpoVE family cell cycle protein [Corynebacterium pyruviciproducens]|uniref:FtsW/RodA/SpoVE family cell cycle protein n=1 Tax=Corynebacterium pyruviciproducens TaxID=598660 RepID=UPI0023EF61BA|nr:putative peptidoglycan glycosyltransferase FtsW [Corynebacterium pyruviciproducens]
MPRYAVESARRDETPARRGASPVPGNGAPAARGDNARRDSARHDGPLVTWWRAQHAKPLVDYGVIMVVIGLLTSLGLVVAYSTTTTWSVVDDDATVWSSAVKQTVFVLIGLVAMWIAMRLQLDWVRRLSPLLMGISIVLLFVVLLIGTGGQEVGSQSWLQLGPVSFQPSELARVSIAIWGSHYLAGRVAHGSGLDSHQWIFIGVSALTCGLIFWQGDVGMTATTLLVVIALLFFTGMSWKWFTGGAIVALAAIVLLVTFGSGYRVERITTFFDALTGHFEETRSSSFQSYQGFLSLGDGGLLGLGLGQSRAKWYYLPEAKNDFVFAVIGEELGLWGGIIVIGLFATLAIYGFRTAMRNNKSFMALMSGTLVAGIVFQAFFNIGYVIGLFPVTGVQLPLLSSGGTATVITLGALGLVASCARHEPEAISSMQYNGFPVIDRILRLPEPSPTDGSLRAAPQTRVPSEEMVTRGASRAGTTDTAEDEGYQRRAAPGMSRERAASAGSRRAARASDIYRSHDVNRRSRWSTGTGGAPRAGRGRASGEPELGDERAPSWQRERDERGRGTPQAPWRREGNRNGRNARRQR